MFWQPRSTSDRTIIDMAIMVQKLEIDHSLIMSLEETYLKLGIVGRTNPRSRGR